MQISTDSSDPRAPLVLVANDQEWALRSLESILQPQGYEVLRAYTGQQAIERARLGRPDVIILDSEMPDMGGVEVCRVLRADPRVGRSTPIILTTAGTSGRVQRLEAFRAGAWEFLGQPLDAEALLLKLEAYVAARREIEQVREDALVDGPTGLYNRRGLTRRAREIATEAYRRRNALACVVLSAESANALDADGMLVTVGETLRREGRSSDAIGRLGEREVAFIAPSTDADGAVRLAQRLGDAIQATRLASPDGLPLRLRGGYTAVSDYRLAEVDPLEMLLRATSALRELEGEAESADWLRAYTPSLH